jgi:SAM-dependent methyltransferase
VSTESSIDGAEREDLDLQRDHWQRTFARRPDFLGTDPSEPARAALERFRAAGIGHLVELGAGQGRDTLYFAAAGIRVVAIDYAADGLEQIAGKAEAAGLAAAIDTMVADVRQRLPLADATVDACYAHMLFCMALTTPELERLSAEVRRVLRPGGLLVYTVRNTADPHFGTGVAHGDDMYEMGGFIVHFFDRALIDRLATGYEIVDTTEYEEGRLPRRLTSVTMRRT